MRKPNISMIKRITKKYIVTVLTTMLMCSYTNAQTFVPTNITVSKNITEKQYQKVQEQFKGAEFHLLLSDNDVRLTAKFKGKNPESVILQKVGNNLYRGDKGGEVIDLELNTVFSYIRSCKMTIYEKRRSSATMVLGGIVTLKRK